MQFLSIRIKRRKDARGNVDKTRRKKENSKKRRGIKKLMKMNIYIHVYFPHLTILHILECTHSIVISQGTLVSGYSMSFEYFAIMGHHLFILVLLFATRCRHLFILVLLFAT